jgi:hypothetical protein
MVVNLNAAKAFGTEALPTMPALADEVLEKASKHLLQRKLNCHRDDRCGSFSTDSTHPRHIGLSADCDLNSDLPCGRRQGFWEFGDIVGNGPVGKHHASSRSFMCRHRRGVSLGTALSGDRAGLSNPADHPDRALPGRRRR